MKPIRSPSRWALLTILLGLGVAHQFFRKSSTAEKEPTAEADRTKATSSSSWFADRDGESSSAVVAVKVSLANQAELASAQAADELTYSTRPISLPEWAPPRSRLDDLMADQRATQSKAVQLEDLKRIKPWLPEPQSNGNSLHQDNSRDVVSLDSNTGGEHRWNSESGQVVSQVGGLATAWPDQRLLPEERQRLLAKAGLTGESLNSRSAVVEGQSGGGPQHRPTVGRATIRAGPAFGSGTQMGQTDSFGDSPTRTVAVPTASSSSMIFRSDDAHPYSEIDSQNMRAEVADRKKRYVYQPGYRPDD